MKAWYGNQTDGDQFYLVTSESVYIDDIDKEEQAIHLLRQIEAGDSPASVMSKDTVHIPLVSVVKIAADLTRYEIEITYKQGKNKEDETLTFEREETFEEAYLHFRSLFGEKFDQHVDQYNVPRAAYGSLWALTIFGFLTWVCFNAAIALEQGEYEARRGKTKLIASVLDLLGPTGVAIVGGIILLLVSVYLVSRVKKPPYYLILQQQPYNSAGTLRVGVNYLILFGAWFLLLRAVL